MSVNKRAVCMHNFPESHCRMKKSPYLCTVKRNKSLATKDNNIY